jgi:hypothetical protein
MTSASKLFGGSIAIIDKACQHRDKTGQAPV